MAGVHSGVLTYDCQMCERTPELKALHGCEDQARIPALEEQEGNKRYVYWNCPLKFIPKNVMLFYRLFRYCKDFSKVPPPEDVSIRFVMAYQYYETKLNEYLKEKANGR